MLNIEFINLNKLFVRILLKSKKSDSDQKIFEGIKL